MEDVYKRQHIYRLKNWGVGMAAKTMRENILLPLIMTVIV